MDEPFSDAQVAQIRDLVRDELRNVGLLPRTLAIESDLVKIETHLSPGPAWDAYVRQVITYDFLEELLPGFLNRLSSRLQIVARLKGMLY